MALQNINFRVGSKYEDQVVNNTVVGGLNINTDNASTVVTPATVASLAQALGWYQWHYQKAGLDALWLNNAWNPLAYNDIITGGTGNDFFVGSTGDDQLHGNGGNNVLIGDELSFNATSSLVTNGSFEQYDPSALLPNQPSPNQFIRIAPSGLTGWTAIAAGDEAVELVQASHGRGDSGSPYWLDMDSSAGNVEISQTIGGLVSGGVYVLRFQANEFGPDIDDKLEVLVDGVVVGTVDPQVDAMGTDAFKTYEFLVNATSPNMTIKFRGTGGADNQGIGLDDVQLFSLADVTGPGGNDTLTAGEGDDTMVGGGGNDTMHGNGGANKMYGGAGNDSMTAGNGNDVMFGGAGNDTIWANEGRNFIDAGEGVDQVGGGNGQDIVNLGAGNDMTFYGNGGDDRIQFGGINGFASDGNETIFGGGGADDFVLYLNARNGSGAGWGTDVIGDFRLSENDALIVFNNVSGFWDNLGNVRSFVGTGGDGEFIQARRGTGGDAGDLIIEFNGAVSSTLILDNFYWNNAGMLTADELAMSPAEEHLETTLHKILADGFANDGPVGLEPNGNFLNKMHDYMLI